MRKAVISDVQKRLKGLQYISESNISTSLDSAFIKGAKTTAMSGRIADVKRVLESMSRTKQDIPFNVCLGLFDAIVERGTISDIRKAGSIICEDITHKVRDAKAMQIVLKQRLTRAKSKLGSNEPENANDNLVETLPPPINPSITEVAIAEYEAMLEKAVIYSNCDRMLENYNRISKRFNIDRLFYENTKVNGVEDTIVELCHKIDTYNMPSDIKFNTVIETAMYGFEHNDIPYTKAEILEGAINYYLFAKDGKQACRTILENSVFFDKNDYMGDIDIITEEIPEEGSNDDNTKFPVTDEDVNKIQESVRPIKENSEFQDIFNKFKEEELDEKPEGKLKGLIGKLYSRNVDDIVKETPSLLAWVRKFFIIATGTFPVVGPIIAIVGLIADRFIALGFERKEVLRMVKAFNNEINKTKDKIKTTEDKETKERLEKYLDALEKARDKIDEYHNDLITDDEMNKKYEEIDLPSASDDDEFDFDDDDFFSFGEAAAIDAIAGATTELEDLFSNKYIDEYDMSKVAGLLTDKDITSMATIAKEYPDIFHKDAFAKGIDNALKNIRNEKTVFESSVDKVYTISALQNAKQIVSEESTRSKNPTVYEALDNLINIKEAYEAINIVLECYSSNTAILEVSVSNRLKMASMKLRSSFQKLKDKDRQVSKNIDLGLNNFKKGVERSLTNDNRESIIKGSILPSASKVIKLAIVNAGLWIFVNPALAIIATLGYLGTSAKYKAKERQMLTDEIEIELKMCRKYIEVAEQKNDMKALKQLLMIERDLTRQHQRIKYKMKANYGQKYYDTKSADDIR